MSVAATALALQAQRPVVMGRVIRIGSLAEALAVGRARALDATLSAANARIAGRLVAIQRAAILPDLSADASGLRQTVNLGTFGLPPQLLGPNAPTVSPAFEVYSATLRSRVPLFDGAAYLRLAAARDSARAASADAQAAAENAGVAVALQVLQLQVLRAAISARREDSVAADAVLAQARAMTSAGMTPELDVVRADVDRNAAIAAVRAAVTAERQAWLGLRLALQLDATDSLELTPLDLTRDADVDPTVPHDAALRRPELEADRLRVQSLTRRRASVVAEQLGSVQLFGDYQWAGLTTSTLFGTYRLNVAYSLPLFDGARRLERIGLEQTALALGRTVERATRLRLQREAESARLTLDDARTQWRLALDRRALAERELALATQRYSAGLATSLETTGALRALIGARTEVLQAQLRLQTARLDLYRSVGALGDLR